jgi:Hypothetical protein (DUF2513)
MHRDMELIRKILMAMEAYSSGFAPTSFTIAGYDQDVIGHHIWLMEQGELVTAFDITSQGDASPTAIPGSITWKGHDFLNSVRTEKVWLKLKAEMKDKGVSLPFALIQQLALKIAAKYVGL